MDKKFFTQPLLIFPDNHKKKSAEIIPELFQRRKVQLFDSQMEVMNGQPLKSTLFLIS